MNDRLDPACSDREILITRSFAAPRALVFKAWSEPEHLVRWWGPQGFTTTAETMDPRPGGGFLLHLQAPDGVVYPCTGCYREVVAPERIVFSGDAHDSHPCGAGLPPRSVVTVTFEDEAGGTRLTIRTRLETAADRSAAAAAGFVEGWCDSLQALAMYLAILDGDLYA